MNFYRLNRYLIIVLAAGLFSGCLVHESSYLAKEQEARRFKSDLEVIQRRYMKIKNKYRKLQEEIKDLQNKGDAISVRLAETIAEREKISEDVKRLETEKNQFKKALSGKADDLGKTITELMNKLDAVEVEKNSIQKELAAYKDLISLRDAEIRGLRRKYRQKADKLTSELSDSQKQAEKIGQKLQKAKAKLEDFEKESAAYRELTQQMSNEIKRGEITITELRGKLRVSMLSKILFDSGKTTIKKEGLNILNRVSKTLIKVLNKDIRIEGHTDSDKIYGALMHKYPTNWELSTTRATTVVRHLVEKNGLDPRRVYAAGYGEYRPIAPNDVPENKAKNRRIEIVIVPR